MIIVILRCCATNSIGANYSMQKIKLAAYLRFAVLIVLSATRRLAILIFSIQLD